MQDHTDKRLSYCEQQECLDFHSNKMCEQLNMGSPIKPNSGIRARLWKAQNRQEQIQIRFKTTKKKKKEPSFWISRNWIFEQPTSKICVTMGFVAFLGVWQHQRSSSSASARFQFAAHSLVASFVQHLHKLPHTPLNRSSPSPRRKETVCPKFWIFFDFSNMDFSGAVLVRRLVLVCIAGFAWVHSKDW